MSTVFQRIALHSVAGPGGCLLWVGSCRGGYARMTIDKRQYNVSRVVLERKLGRPLRIGLCALHTCDVPNCVYEGHLYEGSKKQNAADAIARGQFVHAPVRRGAASNLTKLSEAEVLAIRAAKGTCKQIGQKYGVGPMQVSRIKRKERWGHLP